MSDTATSSGLNPSSNTQAELLDARKELRKLESEVHLLRDSVLVHEAQEAEGDRLRKLNQELVDENSGLQAELDVLRAQLESQQDKHQEAATLEAKLGVQRELVLELEASVERQKAEYQSLLESQKIELQDAKEKLQAASDQSVELKNQILEQDKVNARQVLVERQLERINAQMELVKDVVLRREIV